LTAMGGSPSSTMSRSESFGDDARQPQADGEV
jgi:hypothetical protein